SYHGVATEVQKCPCSPLSAASPDSRLKGYVMWSPTCGYGRVRRSRASILKPCLKGLRISMDGAYLRFCGAPQNRKGIDSIAQLCREKLAADPFSGCVFV